MRYPGKELEVFDKAVIFQKYTYSLIKTYLGKSILEIGAGLGSFTRHYISSDRLILLNDLDNFNFNFLKKKFKTKKNIRITKTKIKNINKKFNTIIYLNVLEHIKNDKQEIINAFNKLKKNGNLIFLVPAHQKLYTKFDKAIGHYRRYEADFFKNSKPKKAIISKLIYLDFLGYLLYFFNKIFFKEEVYPSRYKILLWDKIFMPMTIIVDFFSQYKFGKNILCVYKKL